VTRIVVAGGLGFFGGAVVEQLKRLGEKPLVASRREGGDLRMDVEDAMSLRTALRPGDVIVDTAGPFQDRTTLLVDAAVEIGFDLIDISDSLAYALKIFEMHSRIDSSGVRVLTSCSSASAVTAALVRLSAIAQPLRVTTFLVPAARFSANRAAALSLLRSVGRPVKVWRHGRLETRSGWRESRQATLPSPVGSVQGSLFESCDSVLLPGIWPSLRHVDCFVSSNVPALNFLLSIAARWTAVRSSLERALPLGLALAKWVGRAAGGIAVEVEGEGRLVTMALVSASGGHYTAAVPAAMAAKAMACGRFPERGLIPPDRHVEPRQLVRELRLLGIRAYTGREEMTNDGGNDE
jgi:saccharopine dehydrogenase-like NADP-dependent oxidoreductase